MGADNNHEDRKEKVLHTRIPASLEVEIKKLAHALRVPVSNLVRQMLEDSMRFVETVGARVGDLQTEVDHDRALLHERWARYRTLFRRLATTPARPVVYGWQPLVMNVRGACGGCGRDLPSGTNAHLGLSEDPSARVFRCATCIAQLDDKATVGNDPTREGIQ